MLLVTDGVLETTVPHTDGVTYAPGTPLRIGTRGEITLLRPRPARREMPREV